MSTAPSGWQAPKQNWQSADVPLPTDINRIEGNINAIETANRTLDQIQIPVGNVGTLRQLLDWFANRIKAILGTTNWYDAPPTTLQEAKDHIGSGGSAHALATTAAAGFMSPADKALMPFVPVWMVPSDVNVLAESLSEIRSVAVGTYDGASGSMSKSYSVASKNFNIARPGVYRVTGEFRVSGSGCQAIVLGAVTTSTGYVSFSRDVEINSIGSKLSIRLEMNLTLNYSTYTRYAYLRNVIIKAVEDENPPVTALESQASY